eukprot:gene17273-20599_t
MSRAPINTTTLDSGSDSFSSYDSYSFASEAPPDPGSKAKIDLLYAALLIADITSILGCITVLIGFWRLKLLRNHVTRVISCFCITSCIKDTIALTLTLTKSAQSNNFACYLYSIVITYGSLSCWLWTLCLAKNMVAYVGVWCWISEEYNGWRFGLFYVPFFIIFGVSAILVGCTCHYTWKVIKGGVSDNKDKYITYQFKLVNYIVVFLVCWIFAVINRILNAANLYPYASNLLHTYLSVSHGFFASVVFVYNNPLMWRYFGSKFIKIFTYFGFCLETSRKLDRNKDNNNPSPYTSSRGGSSHKTHPNTIGMESQSPAYDGDDIDMAVSTPYSPSGADSTIPAPIPHPIDLNEPNLNAPPANLPPQVPPRGGSANV